jgi:adenylate kinase family enzyme
MQVQFILAPSGAGKSTTVKFCREHGMEVYDYDEIAVYAKLDVSSTAKYHEAQIAEFNAIANFIVSKNVDSDRKIVIMGLPSDTLKLFEYIDIRSATDAGLSASYSVDCVIPSVDMLVKQRITKAQYLCANVDRDTAVTWEGTNMSPFDYKNMMRNPGKQTSCYRTAKAAINETGSPFDVTEDITRFIDMCNVLSEQFPDGSLIYSMYDIHISCVADLVTLAVDAALYNSPDIGEQYASIYKLWRPLGGK